MKGNPFTGSLYLFSGLRMMAEPGLRSFVIWPLLINVVLFALAIYLLVQQFSAWVGYWLGLMPGWLGFVDWLLWPLFAVLVLVTVYFSFGIVANLIAAPFNGLLSERVESRLRGELTAELGWKAWAAVVPRTLKRELAKIFYMLPRFVALLVVTLIPGLNLISPLLWFLFGAWVMAIQYCDYPMDNNGVSFTQLRRLLKERRLTSLGFGALVSLVMMVPLLNLLVMPAAVVGATQFWVREYAAGHGRAVVAS